MIYLDGFGLSGYRSFGSEMQTIGPLQKLNFLVGQNNSGKSNILLFLKNHFHSVFQNANQRNRKQMKFSPLDKHLGSDLASIKFAIAMNLDGNNYQTLKNKYSELLRSKSLNEERYIKWVDCIFTSRSLSNGTRTAWMPYTASSLGSVITLEEQLIKNLLDENLLDSREWSSLWQAMTNQSGGDIRRHWVPELISSISPINLEYPDIELVPAIRRIGDAGTKTEDHSGMGIIDRIARIQNPGHDEQHLKNKFQRINEFLRTVIGNISATLEIPYDRSMVLVHMDGKTLPLSSLGTGIHEVVILAAAATVSEEMILCIEEPELHLHPLLQKKLCKYLTEHTTNQYIISTHSAHLLDTPDAGIFHVRYEKDASVVEGMLNSCQKTLICADLGYRASDLLQSNCIIWVEGPTDRIYLNHWLHVMTPQLVEGIHYSIMSYGGRLLSHLTANDPDVDDFISLRRLNRYISIIMDSDKSNSKDPINDTKKRIKEEFDKGPGFAWVTQGREIENYINPVIMENAIKAIYKNATGLHSEGQFVPRYWYKDQNGEIIKKVDKVKIAHEVTNNVPDLNILDLNTQMKLLVKFIDEANGMG